MKIYCDSSLFYKTDIELVMNFLLRYYRQKYRRIKSVKEIHVIRCRPGDESAKYQCSKYRLTIRTCSSSLDLFVPMVTRALLLANRNWTGSFEDILVETGRMAIEWRVDMHLEFIKKKIESNMAFLKEKAAQIQL